MCISKLAVDWWKLVGVRRINSGYVLVWTYWMRTFMLRHELSLDSSVIIQYLSVLYVITVLSQHHAFPRQLRVDLWRFINRKFCGNLTFGRIFVHAPSVILIIIISLHPTTTPPSGPYNKCIRNPVSTLASSACGTVPKERSPEHLPTLLA